MALKVLVEKTLVLIEETPTNELGELTVYSLADELKVSRSYLCRAFREVIGMQPREFIQSEKMNRSAKILRYKKQISVNELSEKLGFVRPAYFIGKFKKIFGQTPGTYKNSFTESGSIKIVQNRL